MHHRSRFWIFISFLLATILVLRIYLYSFPETSVWVNGYHIHHLYFGAFLVVILLVMQLLHYVNRFTVALSGIIAALVLDEIVFLATYGFAPYNSKLSILGAVILTVITMAVCIPIYLQLETKEKNGKKVKIRVRDRLKRTTRSQNPL
jgi:uncharacterized membrane protein YhaH (DUF805 family)